MVVVRRVQLQPELRGEFEYSKDVVILEQNKEKERKMVYGR
jgi:hypothetical protein